MSGLAVKANRKFKCRQQRFKHTHTDTHLHCEEVHFGTKILHLPFLLPPYVTILLTQCFSTLQRGTEKADSRLLLFYLEANIS